MYTWKKRLFGSLIVKILCKEKVLTNLAIKLAGRDQSRKA